MYSWVDTFGMNWLIMCSKGIGKMIKQVFGGFLVAIMIFPVRNLVQGICSLDGSRMELYCHSNAL